MKKNYLKLSGLSLAIALFISSCMSEVESPLANENSKLTEEVAIAGSEELGGENLRKIPGSFNYSENFDNQIIPIAIDGLASPQGLYPGIGVGSATRFGKGNESLSFFNQIAKFDSNFQLKTTGAPVTDVFSVELAKLGLVGIPKNVSSITTDRKGNSIWFENIENVTTPESPEKINFKATIKVVGGSGKFAKAYGEGIVEGFYNPNTGVGKSSVKARINF